MESTERGTPGVFGIYLPPDDMRRVISDLESPVTDPHVLGAFGYIRYYQKGSNVEIAEIQSDYYEEISTRSLKMKFKHWEELLLIAFEMHVDRGHQAALQSYKKDCEAVGLYLNLSANDLDYLLTTHTIRIIERERENSKQRISGERVISIPLPSIIRSRWLKPRNLYDIECLLLGESKENIDRSAFSRGLADVIYGRVPDKLGYRGEPSKNSVFVETSNHGTLVPQSISLQKQLGADSTQYQNSPDVGLFLDSFEEISSDTKYQLRRKFDELFPKSVFRPPDWPGFPVQFPVPKGAISRSYSHQAPPGMIMAPIEPKKPEVLDGVNEVSLNVLKKHLQSPELSPLSGIIQPEFTFFSLGVEHGLERDWWNLSNYSSQNPRLRGVAITDQKRHPSVRIYSNGSDAHTPERPMITIGSKGAGLIEHLPEDYFLYEVTKSEGTTFPIALPRRGAEGDVSVPSHEFWGGMSVKHAEAEYRNHLGLWLLFDTLKQNPLDRVAFPLNVGALHTVPIIKQDGVTWMANHDYLTNILDSHSYERADHLGVFISASKCDVRLSQVVNRIFSRTEESLECIDTCEFEIRSALKYLFEVNGVPFIEGDARLKIGSHGVDTPQFLDFVNQLLIPNRDTGRTLYNKLSKRLLTSVGMIHGAGGHLGGGYNEKDGAIGGGATAIRNIDCCGALHDLDLDVYLPWVVSGQKKHEAKVNTAKIFDLVFLKDTLYWLETLLVGRNISAGDSFQTLTVGTPFNKCAFFGNQSIHAQTPWRVMGTVKEKPKSTARSLFSEEDQLNHSEEQQDFSIWHFTEEERKIMSRAHNQGSGFLGALKNIHRNSHRTNSSPTQPTSREAAKLEV